MLLDYLTWLTNYDLEKTLISFYAICYQLKIEINFNSFHINMWLSSSNIFEENQFAENKKSSTYLSQSVAKVV